MYIYLIPDTYNTKGTGFCFDLINFNVFVMRICSHP